MLPSPSLTLPNCFTSSLHKILCSLARNVDSHLPDLVLLHSLEEEIERTKKKNSNKKKRQLLSRFTEQCTTIFLDPLYKEIISTAVHYITANGPPYGNLIGMQLSRSNGFERTNTSGLFIEMSIIIIVFCQTSIHPSSINHHPSCVMFYASCTMIHAS